ncbi:putative reverse transcriptase domain, viral movement protein [Tanacetum coccineum]
MLKKNPPQWTSRQTEAVKAIKCLAEKMPPLKILASLEKRIMQTDASDECWGAVLRVQDNNNKRHMCGYKSGTFKASEQHYHSTFKEILAIKRGIEKFQFHLIRHEFQWKFTVKRIKRTENVLADFLSHPKAYKLEENYPKDASRVQKHTPHFISMVFSVTSHKEEGSSSNPTPTIPVFDLPEEIVETIRDLTFEERAKLCYKMFLTILFKNHGLCIKGLRVVNDERSVMYHAPYCFIHDWYKVNPSSRRCERKLQTFYADTRSLMARANGVEPDKIPYYVMWNISVWNKDHPDAYKWIKANGQWLYDNFDHCDVETSYDDEDTRSLWSLDDDEHFDPFEDDPTHPDARWSP